MLRNPSPVLHRSCSLAGLAGVLCLVGASHAQTPPTQLEPITVTGVARPLSETPAAASVVTPASTDAQGIQLDELLRAVPGLYLQNRYNFAQGQRIAVRGFGARAPFGVRGIRLLVDGFPETVPDGQSQVDAIALAAVERIEVIRGPAAVLQGNASGGVIAIETRDGHNRSPAADLRLVTGSDQLRRIVARGGGDQGDWFGHGSVSHLDYAGHRDQSRVRKTLASGQLGWPLAGGGTLRLVASLLEVPEAEDPGGLTRAQVATARDQASALAGRLDAGETISQQRLGLHLESAGGLALRAFHSRRDFVQQLPFPGPSRPGFQRDFSGVSLAWTDGWSWGHLDGRIALGIEAQRQDDARTRQSVNGTGEVTATTQDERQLADSRAAFGQFDLLPRSDLTLSLGLRFDRLRLSIDDRLLDDGDDSGRRRFDETSASLGATWRINPRAAVFANLSTAFESPTFTEFARPDGGAGFNPALEPQQAINRELGLRGRLGPGGRWELAAFSIRVRDEIVPFEIDGRSFFVNAGRTRRDGLELAFSHPVGERHALSLSGTYARYRFARFIDSDGQDLAGRRLPGLPRHQAFAQWRWEPGARWHTLLETQWTGAVFAENANRERIGGYALVNARVRWQATASGRLILTAGLDNLLDRDYFANVRINANADRPLADRGFFEPGPGRTAFLGLSVGLP